MANRINYQLEMEKVLRQLGDTKPTLLLHACCAPCSSATLERLAEHFRLSILYYNPNIYPPAEYHRREAELERFVEQAGYRYPVIELPYEPDEFYTAVKGLEQEPEKGGRCTVCYRLRLEQTARYAAAHGFEWFCTTLSISPMKDPTRSPASRRKARCKASAGIGREIQRVLSAQRVPQKGWLQAQPAIKCRVRPLPPGLLRLRLQQAGTGRVSRRPPKSPPCIKGDSPQCGEMSRSDREARARRAVSEADGGIVSSVWQVGIQFHTPHFPGGSACPGRRRTRSFV